MKIENKDAWKKNVRRVTPYVPGEQPEAEDMVKLNTNENPYPPSSEVEKAIRGFCAADLKLYPDPASTCLVRALADYYGLAEDQVFVGVGSDDVLACAFQTFFCGGDPVLFPDVTYSFYDVWAELFRIPYQTVKLDRAFRLHAEDYQKKNGGIVIANPNAPTSIYEELDVIEEILRKNRDSVVIVDEAYIDFGGKSALPLTKSYDNLLVVQTFSKSRSMAGMRIGYAMGNPELIRAMNDVKYSFNSYTMNRVSLAAGCAALGDQGYFMETRERIIGTREWVKQQMKELGFSFPDSKANFLFASHRNKAADFVFEKLRQQNIYVRYWKKERIDNYLRVTVGTREEMETFLDAVRNLLYT